jgi:hypothetical protein
MKAQSGEWLCAYCVEPREHELDEACKRLREQLGECDDNGGQ